MSKYTIRTETETIHTDKVEAYFADNIKQNYIYVLENNFLYRVLEENETELQPNALLLCNEDNTEKQLRQLSHFETVQEAFQFVEYNTSRIYNILKLCRRKEI